MVASMHVLALIVTVASGVRLKRTTGGSCALKTCFSPYDPSSDCQCNSQCPKYRNCCSDFWTVCRGNGPSPVPSPPSPAPPPPSFGPSPPGAPSDAAKIYWEGVSFSSQANVKSKIQSGFRGIGYGGLWQAYKEVWVNLPGKCQNSMYEIYSEKCWTPGSDQCGSFRREGDCYNREHSWPKSWWGGGKNTAYSDIFHVMPSDGYVNGKRSNLPFGKVTSADYISSEGHKMGRCSAGKCFEPVDRTKGVVARGHLYVNMKYGYSFKGGSRTRDLMLKWHREFPPAEWEVEFNDRAQKWQNNRNPFIDYPVEAAQLV